VTGPDNREGAPRQEGRSWRFYLLIAAVVLLLIFVVQNSQKVEVDFLFTDTQTPLIFALLIAGGLGALIGWAWPHVRRSRKYERERDQRGD
jgi:uncharacterized integral membrane protein